MTTAIGEALRRERVRRGENQRQAAARFSVSQPTWYRWEAGEVMPSDEFRPSLASFLGVTGEDLYRLLHEDEPTSFSSLEARVKDIERDIADMREQMAALRSAAEAAST